MLPFLQAAGTANTAYQAAKPLWNSYQTASKGVKKIKKVLGKRKNTSGGPPSKRYKNQSLNGGGHTLTYSKFAKGKKKTKIDDALLSAIPQMVRNSSSGSISTTEGRQGWQASNTSSFGWSYADLNALLPASTSSESRLYVQSNSHKIVYCNCTNTEVTLEIYDWEAKIDNSVDPVTMLANSFAAKYTTANALNAPHMNVSEATEFNRAYKVLKRTKKVLQPNENHEHNHFHAVNRYYDNNMYTNVTPPTYLAKFSSGVMIRTLGAVVTDDTKISYGISKVCYVSHKTEKYKVPQGTAAAQMVASIGTLPDTTLSVEKFVEMETGAGINAGVA